jgi:pullulanase
MKLTRSFFIFMMSLIIPLSTYSSPNAPLDYFPWISKKREIKVFSRSHIDPYLKKIQLISAPSKRPIAIQSIIKKKNFHLITLNEDLDITENFILKINNNEKYLYFDRSFLNTHFTYDLDDLGATLLKDQWKLKVWSPMATKISVILYQKERSDQSRGHGKKIDEIPMVRQEKGVWYSKLDDLKLKRNRYHYYYHYKVTALGKTTLALDPYAKSMNAQFSKHSQEINTAALISLSLSSQKDPYSPIKVMAHENDIIIQEHHIRDTTIKSSSVPENLRGTYEGFQYTLPQIKKLGVTHIQFMPLQNFHTVNEMEKGFQGVSLPHNQINYNWGYDPENFFTPEGWYSNNPEDPLARVEELKSMIQKVHQFNMGAILDVVYNHVYDAKSFENVAPGGYLRRNVYGEISYHSGAGASVESRHLMVRKLIVDSLYYFQQFYQFDGMRFDLMGFLDHETMKAIRKKLGPNAILVGEAWEFSDLPSNEATTKSNLPQEAALAVFNDSSRDSYTGPQSSRGVVQGNQHFLPQARAAIMGGLRNFDNLEGSLISSDPYHRYALSPINTLNYLTIHDGHTLWDKINLSIKMSARDRARMSKMALGMLATSQGKIILYSGMENLRTKPLGKNDPHPDRAHTTQWVNEENGISHFHENSYSSSDFTNSVTPITNSLGEIRNDFEQYTQNILNIRRMLPSLHFLHGESINTGLKFLEKNQQTSPPLPNVFSSFNHSDLDSLTIHFINGPRGKKSYLTGEIYPLGKTKNPRKKATKVIFDKKGNASITFDKRSIRDFDLSSWSDPHNLQIKLVFTAGLWDYPASSYSLTGNNKISPQAIKKDKSVLIDLSIVNHSAGEKAPLHDPYLAFELDNTLERQYHSDRAILDFEKILVVFNPQKESLDLNYPCEGRCLVLADGDSANALGVQNTEIELFNKTVRVPAMNWALLGKRSEELKENE